MCVKNEAAKSTRTAVPCVRSPVFTIPPRRVTFTKQLRSPGDNFQFWCKRGFCDDRTHTHTVVVRLPRNTSTHKLTEPRGLLAAVTTDANELLRTCNIKIHPQWRKTPCFYCDQTVVVVVKRFQLSISVWGAARWTLVPASLWERPNSGFSTWISWTKREKGASRPRFKENFRPGEEVVRRMDQTAMSGSVKTDGEYSASRSAVGRASIPAQRTPPGPRQTHLKHQPEEEHHSNTGHNICMVLDDKLVAHHRRVLACLFSDPHLNAVRPNFCFSQRRRSRFLSGSFLLITLRGENARSSLLLPVSKGPDSSWMACHSSACGRGPRASLTHRRETSVTLYRHLTDGSKTTAQRWWMGHLLNGPRCPS